MKARTVRDLNALAAKLGADGWTLVRAARHLVIDWHFGDRTVRQTMANSPSDQRAVANIESAVRRARRAA
jgi:hypothetical protein